MEQTAVNFVTRKGVDQLSSVEGTECWIVWLRINDLWLRQEDEWIVIERRLMNSFWRQILIEFKTMFGEQLSIYAFPYKHEQYRSMAISMWAVDWHE